MLDQQRQSGVAPGKDGPLRRGRADVLRHLCLANGVVERRGLGLLGLGQQPLGGGQAGMGRGHAGLGRVGLERLAHSLDCLGGRNPAERGQGLVGHARGAVACEPTEGGHRLGVAADADRVDRSRQEFAVEFVQGLAEGVVGAGVGDRLESRTGVGGQFFVGQEGGQCRHRLLVAEDGELLAGPGLVERRGVGPHNGDQPLGFRGIRARVARRRRDVLAPEECGGNGRGDGDGKQGQRA